MKKLFVNADMGEGMPNDTALMPYLTHANIACGGHYGTSKTIAKTILLAKKYKVKVGAHPSYPDLKNFGRKSIRLPKETLITSLKNQIDLFIQQCKLHGVPLYHIKLHGALYNDIFNSQKNTQWFLNWASKNYPQTILFVPVSATTYLSKAQKTYTHIEVFADRNYNEDLTLVPRSNPKGVLNSLEKITNHLNRIRQGSILTKNGNIVTVSPQTLCIHGDHPLALEIAKKIQTLNV